MISAFVFRLLIILLVFFILFLLCLCHIIIKDNNKNNKKIAKKILLFTIIVNLICSSYLIYSQKIGKKIRSNMNKEYYNLYIDYNYKQENQPSLNSDTFNDISIPADTSPIKELNSKLEQNNNYLIFDNYNDFKKYFEEDNYISNDFFNTKSLLVVLSDDNISDVTCSRKNTTYKINLYTFLSSELKRDTASEGCEYIGIPIDKNQAVKKVEIKKTLIYDIFNNIAIELIIFSIIELFILFKTKKC